MVLAGPMIDGQQYLEENIAESKYSIFYHDLLPVLLPWSLRIIFDVSRQGIIKWNEIFNEAQNSFKIQTHQLNADILYFLSCFSLEF